MGKDKHYVVFGANGFLGSEICVQLVQRGWRNVDAERVIAVVKADCRVNPRLENLLPDLIIEKMVSITPETLDALHHKYERSIGGIFHVAGRSRPTALPREVDEMLQSNVYLSDVIFQFCGRFNIRTVYAALAKRYVVAFPGTVAGALVPPFANPLWPIVCTPRLLKSRHRTKSSPQKLTKRTPTESATRRLRHTSKRSGSAPA